MTLAKMDYTFLLILLFNVMPCQSVVDQFSQEFIDNRTIIVGEAGNKSLKLLVLLPESSGPRKFPFGAEMCGAAGRKRHNITEMR